MTEPYYSDDRVTVHAGDCLDVLATLPDASVDAVVTDPPYGLEFMGKEWDSFKTYAGGNPNMKPQGTTAKGSALSFAPGSGPIASHGMRQKNPRCRRCGKLMRGNGSCKCPEPQPDTRTAEGANQFQFWCEDWAQECLRVLKPGGHLLAFGGTRTWHRLTCAIEDAGFEIRDSIAWLYGCLDDQTEILVNGRWESYRTATQGDHALCYDVDRDEFLWQPIQRVVSFPHSDTAYRLVGDHTDQLVTRDHRCLIERGGSLVFEQAEEAARQREAHVPVLEDVQSLLDALPLPDQGASGPERNMLEDVRGCRCGHSGHGTAQPISQPSADMPHLRAGVQTLPVHAAGATSASVLVEMQGSQGCRPDERGSSEGPRRLDGRLPGVLQAEDDRGEQSCMERRGDSLPEARELQGSPIRAGSRVGEADGTQRRLRHGTPTVRSEGHRSPTDKGRNGAPHGSRPDEQPNRESGAVQNEQGPQAVRASRFTTTDLVRIEPVQYDGVAWCITVPSGAFVARRNGKVFVTGNSGFPKSLDVSKAIDKAAGAERTDGGREWSGGQRSAGILGKNHGTQTRIIHDTPATPGAERWQGWGTALKPGHEPIILARKPFPATVAANVQEWGTGALNIDGCRIGTEERLSRPSGHTGFLADGVGTVEELKALAAIDGKCPNGRSARATLARWESGHGAASAEPSGRWPANVALDADQAEALDQQSGDRPGFSTQRDITASRAADGWGTIGECGPGERAGFNDSGGASRFFYTAKADSNERPRIPRKVLRLRDDLTPEQVDYVRARLVEAGVEVG